MLSDLSVAADESVDNQQGSKDRCRNVGGSQQGCGNAAMGLCRRGIYYETDCSKDESD